jgi:hypothetical protein
LGFRLLTGGVKRQNAQGDLAATMSHWSGVRSTNVAEPGWRAWRWSSRVSWWMVDGAEQGLRSSVLLWPVAVPPPRSARASRGLNPSRSRPTGCCCAKAGALRLPGLGQVCTPVHAAQFVGFELRCDGEWAGGSGVAAAAWRRRSTGRNPQTAGFGDEGERA